MIKKILQLYPTERSEQISSLLPILCNYVFYFLDKISGFKVIKIGNDLVTLHLA